MLYKSRILGKEYGIKCGAIWDHHGVCTGITKGIIVDKSYGVRKDT
jgi:hypothetical protein